MSVEIKDHENSKRVKVIGLKESELDKLIFHFKKLDNSLKFIFNILVNVVPRLNSFINS